MIPIYKTELNKNELISLNQCLNILNKHVIIFIAPNNLDTQLYEKLCTDKTSFKVKYFDESYFRDIAGYNKLLLSPFFYKTFIAFKFILIYQLDAYVFRDGLINWCHQNYDFIGAPNLPNENASGDIQILKNYSRFLGLINKYLKTNLKITNVGNGGFSLRKTRSCYWLLKLLKSKVDKWGQNNEDGFFKYWGNILYPFFRLPADDIALKFAIEVSPGQSLQKLNYDLPFGCHAFEKYEPEVWKTYIKNL